MSIEPSRQSFSVLGSVHYPVLRIIALVCALLLSGVAFLPLRDVIASTNFKLLDSGFALGLATAAAFGWWFAVSGHIAKSRMVMLFSLGGAGIIGGISFIAAFLVLCSSCPQTT